MLPGLKENFDFHGLSNEMAWVVYHISWKFDNTQTLAHMAQQVWLCLQIHYGLKESKDCHPLSLQWDKIQFLFLHRVTKSTV